MREWRKIEAVASKLTQVRSADTQADGAAAALTPLSRTAPRSVILPESASTTQSAHTKVTAPLVIPDRDRVAGNNQDCTVQASRPVMGLIARRFRSMK